MWFIDWRFSSGVKEAMKEGDCEESEFQNIVAEEKKY